MSLELEVLEAYNASGEKRYRVLVKGTNIVLNVRAGDEEEALKRAREMARQMGLDKVVDLVRKRMADLG